MRKRYLAAMLCGFMMTAMLLALLMPDLGGILLMAGLVTSAVMLLGILRRSRAGPRRDSLPNCNGVPARPGGHAIMSMFTAVGGFWRMCVGFTLSCALAMYIAITTQYRFYRNSHARRAPGVFPAPPRASPVKLFALKNYKVIGKAFCNKVIIRRHYNYARPSMRTCGLAAAGC